MADENEAPAEDLATPDETPEQATKRKFREALAHKNGHAAAGGSTQGNSKIHGTHAKADAKRNFRRRAGG